MSAVLGQRSNLPPAQAPQPAAEPLLSQDWYRVAFMRPRLRAGVGVSRQQVRGETWYVLSDPVSGRHHRLNRAAYSLIASCDGRATLDEVWSARVAADGDRAPSQAEAIRVFAQAFAANLFVGDVAPDATSIVKAQSKRAAQQRRAAINPLAIKVPLWDPEHWLARHAGSVAWLFRRGALAAFGVVLGLGALLFALNAGALAEFAQRELGSGRMLLLLWLAYPPLKALHEMAHAFAVKVYGGEVHEVGITLLLLTPVPYVDASASVSFADKRDRIAVAAAGIAVELLLASFALLLWLLLEPGLARDFAFALVFIGALSTLVVNGNPLLRFDGYYVLSDAAELPNLALRSTRYWQALCKRLLGVDGARLPVTARGERPWLLGYAPLSWLYRSLLCVLFAALLAEWSAGLGLAMLALAIWISLLKPAFAALSWVAQSPEARGRRTRASFALLLLFSLLGGASFGVPLPERTQAPGVVWLPDNAIVRLGSDGFVEALLARDGDPVGAGTPLLQLSNEPLQLELARVDAQLERQRVERALRLDLADAGRAAAADDELARLDAERERLQQRVDALTVRAGAAGRLALDARRIVAGRWLPQGELVAHVLPDDAPLVRALVRNEDIARVRERPGAIGVQLAQGGDAAAATLVAIVPKASSTLPSAALGDAGGGGIAIDPSDRSGVTAREPHFQVDLRLPAGSDARIGGRARVTFRHGDASAAELLARFARESFLRWFER